MDGKKIKKTLATIAITGAAGAAVVGGIVGGIKYDIEHEDDFLKTKQSLADNIISIYNQENGLDENNGLFNAKFRNITSEKDASNDNVYNYSIYLVAQKNETPYIVKAEFDTDKRDVYMALIEHFAENISNYQLNFQTMETSVEILDLINEMQFKDYDLANAKSNSENKCLVNGYFYSSETNSITLESSIVSSYETRDHVYTGFGFATRTDTERKYYNQYTTIEYKNNTNINNFIMDCINNLSTYENSELRKNAIHSVNITDFNYELIEESNVTL